MFKIKNKIPYLFEIVVISFMVLMAIPVLYRDILLSVQDGNPIVVLFHLGVLAIGTGVVLFTRKQNQIKKGTV